VKPVKPVTDMQVLVFALFMLALVIYDCSFIWAWLSQHLVYIP
jgi:hypothetical protein